MENIFDEANGIICAAVIEHYFSVSGSVWKGQEFWTLSPLREDSNIKSGTFSINENGLWNDLKTGQNGNFFQLLSLSKNISLKESAELIIDDFGNGTIEPTKTEKKPKKEKPEPMIPFPESAKEKLSKVVYYSFYLEEWGKPVKIYTYKNYQNENIFIVCRYEKETEGKNVKNHIPFYFGKNGKWIPGRPNIKHYPFYNEHLLSKEENKDDIIIIVEGEPCASVKIPGYILISWIGGTGSVGKSKWDQKFFSGRKIILWPDNDEDGLKAMIKVKSLLLDNSESIEILDIEELGKPVKWDVKDAFDEKIDLEQFIKDCPRLQEDKFPTTPYEAFHSAIKNLYGAGNIDQFDGNYYYYSDKKHFWDERLTINIESDLQTWINENMISWLQVLDFKIHTFVTNTTSFLKRFQTSLYSGNPMKDSALSPYIHLQNGAIHIKENGFDFIDRKEKGECFFKKLYPTHCMDFDFEMKYFKDENLQELAPAFYHYLKSLVPDDLSEAESKSELEKTIKFFSQIIAYCLTPEKKQPKFFAMYGKQGSGKSFFPELMKEIIGEQFFVTRKTNDMINNRFAAADLWGSKIFLDDDVKSDLKLPDDFIKFYSGQKSITVEKKNKDAVKGVKISVAMFFISNHAFKVSGGSEGLERRLIYIPYERQIKKPDTYLKDKIIGKHKKGSESGVQKGLNFDERPAIVGLALRGLESLIENNFEFTMPEWISKERKRWLIESNTITEFIYNMIETGNTGKYLKKEFYQRYLEFCSDEARKPYGKKKFYEMSKMDENIKEIHTNQGDNFILSNINNIEVNEMEIQSDFIDDQKELDLV